MLQVADFMLAVAKGMLKDGVVTEGFQLSAPRRHVFARKQVSAEGVCVFLASEWIALDCGEGPSLSRARVCIYVWNLRSVINDWEGLDWFRSHCVRSSSAYNPFVRAG